MTWYSIQCFKTRWWASLLNSNSQRNVIVKPTAHDDILRCTALKQVSVAHKVLQLALTGWLLIVLFLLGDLKRVAQRAKSEILYLLPPTGLSPLSSYLSQWLLLSQTTILYVDQNIMLQQSLQDSIPVTGIKENVLDVIKT